VLAGFIGAIYGRLARARRGTFDASPARRERLGRPVISVGNLVVGGSGKTPVTAYVAALLADAGEQPAILSRGYKRERADEAVVIVSDGLRRLADFERAGDEPLMLARMLDGRGVRVLVGARRVEAGRIAEERCGATVHVLDDGFQHHALARDVDLLVASAHDLDGETLLPHGRLREPVDAAQRADALLLTLDAAWPGRLREPIAAAQHADALSAAGETPALSSAVAVAAAAALPAARELAARHRIGKAFVVTRAASVPRLIEPYGLAPRVERSAPVIALAGIARPERFFESLREEGWEQIVARVAFRDHHAFSDEDLRRVAQRVRETQAQLVLTTEKDVMRLLRKRPLPFPVAWVPQTVSVEPADEFRLWLLWRLAQARLR
jgi:tetraacyldisaccharide 4'-kinase